MTQRQKIAIAYAFAVPVAVVVFFLLRSAQSAISSTASDMATAAQVIDGTDIVIAGLRNAGSSAQKYAASGADLESFRAHENSVLQLRKGLKQIDEQTKGEQTVQSKLVTLIPLIEKQIRQDEQMMAASRKRAAAREKGVPIVTDPGLTEEIGKNIEDINAVERIRLQHQGEATAQNVRKASVFTLYGGGAIVWLVGVGAFLLFHDEKTRVWAGIERRVHTNVLQSLPLGVTVATENGLIVYANPAEENLMGFERGGLLGSNATILHDLEGKASEPTVNAILADLNADKVWKGELPVRKKDGTTRNISSWVMNIAFPGKVYRTFVHLVD